MRKATSIKLGVLLCGAVLALSSWCHGITYYVPETWSVNGDVEGWQTTGGGTLSQVNSGGNPGGYLETSYTSPFPGDLYTYADSGASGGTYVGNLSGDPSLGILFDFLADNYQPSSLAVYFYSSTSGNTWLYSLDSQLPTVGTWDSYYVPLGAFAGWELDIGGGLEASVLADLADVDQIGVYIMSAATGNEQNYGLDNWQYITPEPQTVALMMAAVFSLGMTFRRRLTDVGAMVKSRLLG